LLTNSYPATSYSKAHPARNSILFANQLESISRRPDLEHLDTPPADVMHYSVFTDEYWQFFNPLDDDDAVTMDTPQYARAAATGPRGARSECASNPHLFDKLTDFRHRRQTQTSATIGTAFTAIRL
jgi:hypothetical protein